MPNSLSRILKDLKDSTNHTAQLLTNFSFKKLEAKHFIILTRERTGSTCLLDLLSSHSRIKTDPHIFYNYNSLPQVFKKKNVRYRNNIHGFKFKVQASSLELTTQNQIKAENGLRELVEQGVQIVYLQRENLVKQAVSWLLADCAKLKKQNYRKGQKPIKIKSMNLQPNLLLERIQQSEKLLNFEKSILTDLPYLYLSYEKDLMPEEMHQITLDRICNFLNIQSEKAITRYVKLSSNDLSDNISNYEEIYECLKQTKYFDQLDN